MSSPRKASKRIGAVVCLLLVWADDALLAGAQEQCITPSRSAGTCIPIEDCTFIQDKLAYEAITTSDSKLIEDSKCSAEEGRVCCPTAPSECRTPNDDEGVCVPIPRCPRFQRLLTMQKPLAPSTVQLLRSIICLGPERFSICCEVDPPANAESINADELLATEEQCENIINSDRILGGSFAGLDEFPWIALLEYSTKRNTSAFGCAASLISPRYVLTAAHCVVGDVLTRVGTPVRVRLGEYNTKTLVDCVVMSETDQECNEAPTVVPIERISPHPGFLPQYGGEPDDIALIRMDRDVAYTDFIKPICLPLASVYAGGHARAGPLAAAGWGHTETGRPSEVLLRAELPLVGLNACALAYSGASLAVRLGQGHACAGGRAGVDTCRGDSGGPLAGADAGGRSRLEGVLSFGPGECATAGVPGVYTDVYHYRDWIRAQLRP